MIVEKTRLRRLGYGVLILLLLIATGLYATRVREEDMILVTVVKSVDAIKPGAEILIAGYQVGNIRSVRPLNNRLDSFEIVLGISFPAEIPSDSVAQTSQGSPFENAKIEIVLGEKTDDLMETGETITFDAGGPGLLDQVSELAPKVDAVLDQVSTVLKTADGLMTRTDGTIARVHDLIGDPNAPPDPDARSVTAVLGDVRRSLSMTEALLADLRTDLDAIDAGGTVTRLTGQVGDVLTSLQETARKAERLATTLEATAGEANGLVAENRAQLNQISERVARLLTTLAADLPPLLAHMKSLSFNLNRFAVELRRDPNAVLFGRQRR